MIIIFLQIPIYSYHISPEILYLNGWRIIPALSNSIHINTLLNPQEARFPRKKHGFSPYPYPSDTDTARSDKYSRKSSAKALLPPSAGARNNSSGVSRLLECMVHQPPAPAVTVFFILVTARCVYILRNFAISASVLFPYTGIFASSVSGFSYSSCVSVTEAAPKFSSMRSVFRIPGIGTMKYHAVNPKAAGYAPHFPD